MEGVLAFSRGSVIMVSLFQITHRAKEKKERGEKERGRKRQEERKRREGGERWRMRERERGKKINLTICDITYISLFGISAKRFSKTFQ